MTNTFGELLRDSNDLRRRGVRWEDISLDDGSMDVYRKKQQWDAASLPDPVMSPLRSYRKLTDPPTDRWPVFPTFNQQTLATLVRDELADRGERPEAIDVDNLLFAFYILLRFNTSIRQVDAELDVSYRLLRRYVEQFARTLDAPAIDLIGPVEIDEVYVTAGLHGRERDFRSARVVSRHVVAEVILKTSHRCSLSLIGAAISDT